MPAQGLTALSTGIAWLRRRRGQVALATILAVALGVMVSSPSSGRASRYRDPVKPSAGGSAVSVGVDPSVVQRRIPRGFLGLSIEYWALENYAGKKPGAINPVLVRLIRNVVSSKGALLRIGGVTTDKTWWPVPGIAQPKGVNYTLNNDRLEVAGALARKTGTRLIMGVQFEADSATLAQAEAAAMLARIGRQRLTAFELGNEPELFGDPTVGWYTQNGQPVPGRPPGYDVNAFTSDFTHIAAAMPGQVPVAGPSSFVGSWLGNVSTFLSGAPRVGLVTLHEYPFEACALSPSSPDYPTISRLLSPVASTELASGEVSDIQAAHARHLPVSIDEMNAVSCGNPPRLANSFALALWVVDALFAEAAAGVDSVEVHTWPGALYQLFTVAQGKRGWDASVYPEYYGLLLFSQATPPGSSLVRSSSGNTLIRAWATRGPGKAVRVALINDDPAASHRVSVRIAGARGTATVEFLRAPSVSSSHGVTLAHQGFGRQTSTGALSGARATVTVTRRGGAYSVSLPGASAALLTLR